MKPWKLHIQAQLIGVLVLALVAQSPAAASMRFCGPNHHAGQGEGPARSVSFTETREHERSTAKARRALSNLPPVAKASALATSSGKPSTVRKQKCSACASCCLAGAVPDSAPIIQSPQVARAARIDAAPRVPAPSTHPPDRPPRSVLA